jgi:hypothetical protein
VSEIKGELGTYVKSADADARYLKQSDAVVRGDGSVFSDSRLIPPFAGTRPTVLDVPGLIAVEAESGKPPLFYVVNRSAGPLTHTACEANLTGAAEGVIQPGQFFHCQVSVNQLGHLETSTVQLFSEGPEPVVITLTVSIIPVGQAKDQQYTAQALIGS